MNLLFILATLTLCVVAEGEKIDKEKFDAALDDISEQFAVDPDSESISYRIADIWYWILFDWTTIGEFENAVDLYDRAALIYKKIPFEKYYRLFMKIKEDIEADSITGFTEKEKDALSILEKGKSFFDSVKSIFNEIKEKPDIIDKANLERIRYLFTELFKKARDNNLDPTEVHNMFWKGTGFLCDFFIFEPEIVASESENLNLREKFARLTVLIITAAYIEHGEPPRHIAYLPFICKIRQDRQDSDHRAKLSLKEIAMDIHHPTTKNIVRLCNFKKSEYLLNYLVRFKKMYYFNQQNVTRRKFDDLDKLADFLITQCIDLYKSVIKQKLSNLDRKITIRNEYEELTEMVSQILYHEMKLGTDGSSADFLILIILALVREPKSNSLHKIRDTMTIFNPKQSTKELKRIFNDQKNVDKCKKLCADVELQELHKSIRSLFRFLSTYYDDSLRKLEQQGYSVFKHYMLTKVCKFVVLNRSEEEAEKNEIAKSYAGRAVTMLRRGE